MSSSSHPQDEAHAASISDPTTFWSGPATELCWETAPKTVLHQTTKRLPSGSSHAHWSWFSDGRLSTTYNCIDRHVVAGHGARPAIIYDSPVTSTKRVISYAQLQTEVALLAGVLREEGVRPNDVVMVYMPMIPAALIGILAVAQLGAVHSVVFGGFSAASLAQRIDAAKPVLLLTASCGIEGAKGPLNYRPLVRGAMEASKWKTRRTLVWQRTQAIWNPLAKENGELDWKHAMEGAKARGVSAAPVARNATDALYIIYTSGTTGSPKGVVRQVGGHAVGLNHSVRYLFGLGPGDVMFCASDIGWVVGHSYILYAPLLAGATTVLFEGKPVGTPDAGTFWRIVEEHRVNVMFTAPTALRAIRGQDPKSKMFVRRGETGGLRSLRALFLAGERSEPAIVSMYKALLDKYCSPGANVVDNWWSSESGSPISGLAQRPTTGLDWNSRQTRRPYGVKPGSAGKAMPGFDVRIVNDEGKELLLGEMGNVVLRMPLAPTAFTTLFKDEERFFKSYLLRFQGRWFDTGDAGMLDEDGYIHIMARSDDIINVAAHRLSTGAIEQAISSHSSVTEACVVPIPDNLKGHLPFAFAISPDQISHEKLLQDLNATIREQIGAIATLGGVIVSKGGIIPKTRSGKTLRRVLRQLVEDASQGNFHAKVDVPATIEDAGVVESAREAIREYFEGKKGKRARL